MKPMRVLLLFVSGMLICLPAAVQASTHHHSHDDAVAVQSVAVSELPPEARDTLHIVLRGSPYPYPRDGVVFGNYEHKLPQQQHGYYHEYTVKTPGVRNRGARRIVCGPLTECYYSGDHYRTFRRITEEP